MSYLAQELVGLNLNCHPQDFHLQDQETLPVSPNVAINNSSSLKRRLPVPLPETITTLSKGEDFDDNEYQEPIAKRISLRDEVPNREQIRRTKREEREDIHYALSGFSKISLPDVSTISTPLYPPPKPGLRRTVSDGQAVDRGYFFNQESCGYDQSCRDLLRPESQERFTFGTNDGVTRSQNKAEEGVSCGFVRSGSSLPPHPPPLRRTLSEPTPSPNELFLKSTVDGEGSAPEHSPNSQRLERMKLRLREMSEWWAKVLREADGVEEEDCQDGPNQDCTGKHDVAAKVQGGTMTEQDDMMETEKETQEAVSVEMLGECLSINFSCPCNKGYQILLSGKNCYYKLV